MPSEKSKAGGGGVDEEPPNSSAPMSQGKDRVSPSQSVVNSERTVAAPMAGLPARSRRFTGLVLTNIGSADVKLLTMIVPLPPFEIVPPFCQRILLAKVMPDATFPELPTVIPPPLAKNELLSAFPPVPAIKSPSELP